MLWLVCNDLGNDLCTGSHLSAFCCFPTQRTRGICQEIFSLSLSLSTGNCSVFSTKYPGSTFLHINSFQFLGLSDCPLSTPLQAVHPWRFQDVGRVNCAGPTYPQSLMTGKNPRLPSKTLTSTWVRSVFISSVFLWLRTQVSCEADSAPWSLSHHANY